MLKMPPMLLRIKPVLPAICAAFSLSSASLSAASPLRRGVAAFSNPTNTTGKALNENNRIVDNQMGRNGTDTNRFDIYNDGSGKGNCFEGNQSSTFDLTATRKHTKRFLYPSCPAPASAGTGGVFGDGNVLQGTGQQGELALYVVSDPPCSQEDQWVRHKHPAYKGITPIDTKDLGKCKASP